MNNGTDEQPAEATHAVAALLSLIATSIVALDRQMGRSPIGQDFRQMVERLLPTALTDPALPPDQRPHLERLVRNLLDGIDRYA